MDMVEVGAQFPAGNVPAMSAAESGRRGPSRVALGGLALLGILTLWTLLWAAYRVLVRPGWFAALPELLQESVRLMEFGAVMALLVIWLALGWRSWQRRRQQWRVPLSVTVEELYALSPQAFERYVGGLFRLKGYRVTLRGGTGDHGVDLEVRSVSGKLAVVQCKRYQNTIGADVVRELYGTMIHERAIHGFLVTTAEISDAAREWAAGKPLTLIDGETLVDIAAAVREQIERRKKPQRRRPLSFPGN